MILIYKMDIEKNTFKSKSEESETPKKRLKYYIWIGFITVFFVYLILFIYVNAHGWDNMGKTCRVEMKNRDDRFYGECFLQSIVIFPEERKGLGRCICIYDTLPWENITGKKIEVNFTNNIWYKMSEMR